MSPKEPVVPPGLVALIKTEKELEAALATVRTEIARLVFGSDALTARQQGTERPN